MLAVKNTIYCDMTLCGLVDTCVLEEPAPVSSGLKCKPCGEKWLQW